MSILFTPCLCIASLAQTLARAVLDPWAALGLEPTADTRAVKSAHRRLVRQLHPDCRRGPEDEAEAMARFLAVQQAYELLTGRGTGVESGDSAGGAPAWGSWEFHDW